MVKMLKRGFSAVSLARFVLKFQGVAVIQS